MNKNDILIIITIANGIKDMWQSMTYIEEIITRGDISMLEPFFHKFMMKGYTVNDLCINIEPYIEKNSYQTKAFFEDILDIVLKINYLIEKNISLISKNILTTFKDFKKQCEGMFYWDHESDICIRFELYSA